MIFICVICFGVSNPENLAIGAGCAIGGMGLIQIAISCKNKFYFSPPPEVTAKDFEGEI